ncbi:MAG TPA: GNAT family N-acetyltransferase [Gaiellaceae bacterium]|nr:GNAT family N-acetyltransferase [Gaiellaceae bacterium]
MIRRAGPQDVDGIAAVFTRSFATLDFLPTLHTPEQHHAFLGGRVLAEQEVWVAERDGRILGFIALDGDLGTLFCVDPDEHGCGIGSALFAEVQRERPNGFRFWVFQQNARARRFYEARGCTVLELTDGSGNEERTPDALYQWLPAGQGSSAR